MLMNQSKIRPRAWSLKRATISALSALLIVYLGTAVWQVSKPLPDGLNLRGDWQPVGTIQFLADSTWLDSAGEQHTEQVIFDTAFDMIEAAETLVVSDFFLINRFAGQATAGYRSLSLELVESMAARREARPELFSALITDPFNELYQGVHQPLFDTLEQSGVRVIRTDLGRLRDSNPAWSAAWRICCQWFGNSSDGWLPNPVGEARVSLRTWLALINFKANHRKVLIADVKSGPRALVTSANPHDASSRHSNTAVVFDGRAVGDLLESERAVVRFSIGQQPDWIIPETHPITDPVAELRIVTEAAIRDSALDMINTTQRGDSVDMLMFYLSQRDIIEALIDSHRRGANVRVLLDPNEDAFGRKKNGVPNRQVASELHQAGIAVRWCNTQGEQCHGKMLLTRTSDGQQRVLTGSANFTRRNLDNYNLETNVEVRAASNSPFMDGVSRFFNANWHNTTERIHSLPYSHYADESRLRYWQYRFMEASGLSTF